MTTFFPTSPQIVEVNAQKIIELKEAATSAPLKRARFCLHGSHDDLIQEMLIVFCKGSYVPPHRHLNKSESFHVVEGELAVILFDEKGDIVRKIKMIERGSGFTFLYRLACDLWHTVVPLSEYAVIHEVTDGPYNVDDTDYAPWGPDITDSVGINDFLAIITG